MEGGGGRSEKEGEESLAYLWMKGVQIGVSLVIDVKFVM